MIRWSEAMTSIKLAAKRSASAAEAMLGARDGSNTMGDASQGRCGWDRLGPGQGLRGGEAGGGGAVAALLHLQKLAIDAVRNADAARLGDRLGVFLREHAAIDVRARARGAERTLALQTGEHLAEAVLQEHRL